MKLMKVFNSYFTFSIVHYKFKKSICDLRISSYTQNYADKNSYIYCYNVKEFKITG